MVRISRLFWCPVAFASAARNLLARISLCGYLLNRSDGMSGFIVLHDGRAYAAANGAYNATVETIAVLSAPWMVALLCQIDYWNRDVKSRVRGCAALAYGN